MSDSLAIRYDQRYSWCVQRILKEMVDTVAEKRYYWLKLNEDFFRQKVIKKLRRTPNGDTYTIIYLKMQLLSLNTDGRLIYEGVETNIAEELSLELDEDVDDVKATFSYLQSQGLAEMEIGKNIVLPEVVKNTGKEGAGAERMRRFRLREENEASQCSDNTSQNSNNVTLEIRDKNKEIERVRNTRDERFEKFWNAYPRKVGKGAAEQSFKKYRPNDELLKTILAAIENQKRSEQWQKSDGKYIPNPATWLNQKRWEDECQIHVLQPRTVTFDIAEYEASSVFDNMDIPR